MIDERKEFGEFYCETTVGGIELDEYCRVRGIVKEVCYECNPNVKNEDNVVYKYCPKHQAEEEIRYANHDPFANFKEEGKDRKRSDGKPKTRDVLRACMSKAERRQIKIDKRRERRHHKKLT